MKDKYIDWLFVICGVLCVGIVVSGIVVFY